MGAGVIAERHVPGSLLPSHDSRRTSWSVANSRHRDFMLGIGLLVFG